MGILTILLTVLTSVFVSALDVQSESSATSSDEQDGNYIIARLSYDIHRAQGINIPLANGETGGNFQIVIDNADYTYSVDENDNLVITGTSGTNNLNSYGSRIPDLSVRRLGNPGGIEDSLRINFTITSREQRVSGPEVKNFQTTLSIRRQ